MRHGDSNQILLCGSSTPLLTSIFRTDYFILIPQRQYVLTSPCPSITPQVTGQREDAASPLPASGAGPPRLPVGRAEVTSARYHGDGGAGSGGRDSGGLCYAGSYLTGPGADTQQIHG